MKKTHIYAFFPSDTNASIVYCTRLFLQLAFNNSAFRTRGTTSLSLDGNSVRFIHFNVRFEKNAVRRVVSRPLFFRVL